ncbi:MAG: type VI secretion system tube protein Hcp [Myxococcota bacterium]
MLKRIRPAQRSHPFSLALFALLSLMFMLTSNSASAFEVWAFIEVNGSALPGITATNPAKDGGIPVSSFRFSAARPFSPTTGLPTGSTQKTGITVTKDIDGASPLLFRALTNNEPVNSALFRFFRTNENTGQEEVYYEVEVTNGVVFSQAVIGGVNSETEALKIFGQVVAQTDPISGVSHSY